MRLTREQFERLVVEALDSIPEPIARRLDNVEVVIEGAPTRVQLRAMGVSRDETLLGLYEGIPLTERTTHYGLVLPDKITLFQYPIQAMCASEAEVRAQVAHTVVHEFAHFFGIDDEQLRRMGAY